jgi:hypothetical protein
MTIQSLLNRPPAFVEAPTFEMEPSRSHRSFPRRCAAARSGWCSSIVLGEHESQRAAMVSIAGKIGCTPQTLLN